MWSLVILSVKLASNHLVAAWFLWGVLSSVHITCFSEYKRLTGNVGNLGLCFNILPLYVWISIFEFEFRVINILSSSLLISASFVKKWGQIVCDALLLLVICVSMPSSKGFGFCLMEV